MMIIHRRISLVLLTLFLALAGMQLLHADAQRDRQKLHKMRMEYENREWTAPEITLNVHQRVPVVDAVGYLAVNYDAPQRLQQLLLELRPLAERITVLSGGTYEGRKFPTEVEAELDQMQQKLYSDITRIYGTSVTARVQEFVGAKYNAL
ncbi:MAG: hypothetical protein AAGA45_01755 [Verrucomicrobiota bacterium]